MVVTTFRIPYKYGDIIKIKPLFDIHYGNKYCDVAALKAYLADSDTKTYFIGGGDWLDSIRVTDKRYEKHADATETDAVLDEQVVGLYQILVPYKKRILAAGIGNHEKTIIKHCSTDPMKRLCELLDCDYIGYSWLVRLLFRTGVGAGRAVIVRGHHGWGGGSRTQGADLTKFSKDTMHWTADLFLYGHVHRKQSDRVPRLGLVGETLISKPKLIGLCGTFLKTLSTGPESTYSEEKGYPPTEIGGITVSIKPYRKWVKMWIDV